MRQPSVYIKNKRTLLLSVLFVLPVFLLTLAFMVIPIVYSFALSFTRFDGVGTPVFIGLANYAELFGSREFWSVLSNNFYFFAVGVPVSVVMPLLIAVLLYEEIAGNRFFKIVYLLPGVLSTVVVGIYYRTFFAYDGPLNRLLTAVGLERFAINWLESRGTSLPIILLALVWYTFGQAVIIYMAGMTGINLSIYESANLDGAGWFQRVFYITIPQLAGVIEFITVLSVINVFSCMFGLIHTITSGGPGYESTTLEYLLYIKGFRLNEYGYSNAVAVVLFILIITISRIIMSISRKGSDWIE